MTRRGRELLVKELMEKAKTSTGLKVTVEIMDKVYQTGRKYAEGFKKDMKIVFDEILPKWNYRAVPRAELNNPVVCTARRVDVSRRPQAVSWKTGLR